MTKEEYMDQIKKVYDTLPEDIQNVIVSSDYQQKLFEISKKTKLSVEQLGDLEIRTTMVLLGLAPFDDYEIDVEQALNIHDDALDQLVEMINKDIFRPIRESLKEIHPRQDVDVSDEISEINVLGQDKKDILRNSGIETENIHSVPIQKNTPPANTFQQNKVSPLNANNVARPVVTKTMPTNPMFADKLNKPVQNNPQVTNYSVKPISSSEPKHGDPYREPVE